MTDPLRPFTQAIRSLWGSRARATQGNGEASPTAPSAASGTAQRAASGRSPGETLRSRLKTRITQLDGSDPRKMREAFVETVLLWELGEHLAPDPEFHDLVARVFEQLETDAEVGDRLHQVLMRMSEDRGPRSPQSPGG
jgi:hypothetical protein